MDVLPLNWRMEQMRMEERMMRNMKEMMKEVVREEMNQGLGEVRGQISHLRKDVDTVRKQAEKAGERA
eukprot:5080221-Karenia_brevis.AAC.1